MLKKYYNKIYKNFIKKEFSIFRDIQKRIPEFEMFNFFDVGANEGFVALEVLENYPNCEIYCFEPNINTYNKLKFLNKNINSYNYAIGNNLQKVFITDYKNSTLNTITNKIEHGVMSYEVDMITLDLFCLKNNIHKISYLKIDTEGHDLEVLKGSISKLSSQEIAFIEVEAGMNLKNFKHVHLQDFINFFHNYNYNLFKIYEQVSERSHDYKSNFYFLRRSNIVFVLNDLNNFFIKKV